MVENSPIKTETYKIIKKKKKRKHPIIRGIFKTIFTLILILIILILIGGGFVAYKLYGIVKDVRLSKNDIAIKYENSVLKDIEGNTIGVLNGEENRQSIPISDMSKYIPMAFVSIEDERFEEHKGVDIKRTLGATYTYIKNKGQSPFGGSSITQQLVKNLTSEKDDTWQRKVREMARAYYLEQEMSKEEILELYLNLIFLGDTVYGVEQGSVYYFNKNASELSIAESAFLAGVNHSPNSYNAFSEDKKDKEKVNSRTKTVIEKMYQLGKINEDEYNLSIKEIDEGLKFSRGTIAQTVFSYHTDAAINQIIKELMQKNEWTENQAKLYISSGGFTIYTTLDPKIQEIMDAEYNDPKLIKTTTDEKGNLQTSQSAMVILNHKTGHVLAVRGGVGEKTTAFGFNRATAGKRQTGSSMKPIAVVAPGIDQGIITAATIFDDDPTTFTYGNRTYTPKNYNYYRGLVTTREAIGTSQNIPMVKGMNLLTPEKSIEFLKNAGITSIDEKRDNVLPLALGGLTYGITPLEMAGAYGLIANDGLYIQPTFYTKVVDSNGNVIMEPVQRKTQVMSKEAAYVVKEILTEPVKSSSGTATNCSMDQMSVAAKTGTSNSDYDRWLCGFTPYYTASVWYGYDSNATITGWSLNPAGIIWSDIMRQVHIGLDMIKFSDTKPENVVEVEVCKKSGFLATSSCRWSGSTYTEYFVKGTEPVQTCPYHSSAKVCTESGLLATPGCPTVKYVYGRGEYINAGGLWQTRSSYYSVKNVPLKACTLHGGT